VEQHQRFGFRIGGLAQVEDVAVGPQTADDAGARRSGDAVAGRADGDFAVVADPDVRALAPDVGPPGAGGSGAQDGALFGQRLVPSGLGCRAQFAVDFVSVGVRSQLVEQVIGTVELMDLVGGQQGREAFLPVVVAAFDFAFGLGRGGVAQGHAVKVEGSAELGEGVGGVGEEEGVVIDVEGQGQAVGDKGAGQKVQMGQEGFAFVEAGSGVDAGGVVEQVEQALFVGGAGQEGVRSGVILPEGTEVADLPAFDGLGWLFVASVGGQLLGDGPAADAGAVGFEVQPAQEFAGAGTVGGGRLGGEQRGELGGDCGRPVGLVIAAGVARDPGLDLALGGGAQIVAVEFVEAGSGQLQFGLDAGGAELPGAELGQQVADERSGQTMDQLEFFIGPRVREEDGFCALKLTPAELGQAGPPAGGRPSLPPVRLQAALRLRPRRALSSAKAPAMMRLGGWIATAEAKF